MNQPVLPQLQSIEVELASQEEQLAAQLAEVTNKLNGVRAVLPMFSNASGNVSSVVSVAEPSKKKRTKASSTQTKKAETSKAETLKATAKKTTTSSQPAAEKSSPKAKKDGRTAEWQKYVRKGVEQKTIPEAVLLILQTQPDKSFKIIDMMKAIFEDDMPRDQYLKARNRISNLLSGGVRDNQWYRGERSTYRLTQ